MRGEIVDYIHLDVIIFRTCHLEPEHIYEEVKKESQMKTLDIRLNHCRKEKFFGDNINGYKL